MIGESRGSSTRPGPLPGRRVLLANVAQGLVRFDARGQIEPGLAERWNVSNDGLSYIFRLGVGRMAEPGQGHRAPGRANPQAATRRQQQNPMKDTLGAVDEIVAMTDRVLEIRLRAPRPNLLPLLAQPEFASGSQGQGSGPFRVANGGGPAGDIRSSGTCAAPMARRAARRGLAAGRGGAAAVRASRPARSICSRRHVCRAALCAPGQASRG